MENKGEENKRFKYGANLSIIHKDFSYFIKIYYTHLEACIINKFNSYTDPNMTVWNTKE